MSDYRHKTTRGPLDDGQTYSSINLDGVDLFKRYSGTTAVANHYHREGEKRSQLQQFHALLPEESPIKHYFVGFLAGNILKYAMRTLVKGEPLSDWNKMVDFVHATKSYYELLGEQDFSGDEDFRMVVANDGYFEDRTQAAAYVRRHYDLIHIYNMYCTLGIAKTAQQRTLLFEHINRVRRIERMVYVLSHHPDLGLGENQQEFAPPQDFLYDFLDYVTEFTMEMEGVIPMLTRISELGVPGYQLFGSCDPLYLMSRTGLYREYRGFLLGNIHKYVYRLGQKDARDKDINKAVHYACLYMACNTPERTGDSDNLTMSGGVEVGLPILDYTAEDYFNSVIQTVHIGIGSDSSHINIQKGIAALKGIKINHAADYHIQHGPTEDRELTNEI